MLRFPCHFAVIVNGLCREGKEEWVPFDSTPYCSTSAFDAASPIFHEVLAALQSLNVPVEQVKKKICCADTYMK